MIMRNLKRPEGCPSDFAFDRQLAGEVAGEEKSAFDEHVLACARCSRRFAEISREKEAFKKDAPRLVLEKRAPQRRTWLAPGLGVGAIALAASLILLVRGKTDTRDYVGLKGTPAVQLLVHRDKETFIWDGRTPVHPGDALALRVACEGLGRVVVAAPGPAEWQRLSDTACPETGDPLPFTLVVDKEPGSERLAVVLSQDAMDGKRLKRAIEGVERTKDVWAVEFVLPKETGTPR